MKNKIMWAVDKITIALAAIAAICLLVVAFCEHKETQAERWVEARGEQVQATQYQMAQSGPFLPRRDAIIYSVTSNKRTYWFQSSLFATRVIAQNSNGYEQLEY